MRVLQLGKYYYPYKGGIENHVQVLCNELRPHVHVEAVVCNSRRASSTDDVDGVPVTRCFELVKVASTSICPSMPLALSRRHYDVLHLHFPHPMGVMSYLASRHAHRHAVVVSYHSDIVKQERLLRLYRPFMERVLRRADAIVCATAEYLEGSEILVPHREKCRIIPYGIDCASFERTPAVEREAAAIRARFGGRPLVLSVGRLVYYKGFEHLVRAMRDVDAELVVVGGGPLLAPLEQTARECGVASRVHFLGEVEGNSLAAYYAASDVYALPSIARSEAFALVQLEAMASGVPVVNTAIARSGVPSVSRDGESGLTVPPADAPALARALTRILGDREMARRFGNAGRARARREFSKEVMAERMLALYEETTALKERPHAQKDVLRA